jgi:hypothetical protein
MTTPKLADYSAVPVKTPSKEKWILRNSIAIGSVGAPTVSGDPGVTLTRTGPGTYSVVFPACLAASLVPTIGKSSTLASARLTAKDATAGTATLETLVAAGASSSISLPLVAVVDADGDPIVKFVDGASAVPGFNLADSEAFGIRWNNNATHDAVLTSFVLPANYNEAGNITLTVHASKTGATDADDTTFTVTAFAHPVGALHDADANFGGVTSAMVGTATAKTVQSVSLTLAAADLPAGPCAVSLTIKPTDGTLATDDVIVLAVTLTPTAVADPASGDIIELLTVGQPYSA